MTFDPGTFVRGDEQLARALEYLCSYFTAPTDRDNALGYTGSQFERLCDTEHANEITELDLVAVTALSVQVPARAAIWILGEGKSQISALLEKIGPPSLEIWDEDAQLRKKSAAWDLWQALRWNSWPTKDRRRRSGIGPTTASKLMAAKRPHLIPIRDSVVCQMLGIAPNDDDWALWQEFLRGSEADAFKRDLTMLAAAAREKGASIPEEVSILRLADVVVWMAGTES